MQKNPFVLVAIPVKGEIDLTIQCLKSLSQSYVTGLAYSVLLWDDGSTNDELNHLYNNRVFNESIIIQHPNVGYTQSVYNLFNETNTNFNMFDYLVYTYQYLIFFYALSITVAYITLTILGFYNNASRFN
jgi:hypothetical protein